MINIFNKYSLLFWNKASVKPDDKKGNIFLVESFGDYFVAYYVSEKNKFFILNTTIEIIFVEKWAYLK